MNKDDEDYVYIYLEFNETISSNIFSDQVFLRVANLNKPNPLVQINNHVFRGSYDECVGTNLFFEEIKDPPLKTNIYEKETPIRLNPLINQTKTIRLKPMKIPNQSFIPKQTKDEINLNLNQDYQIVLDKFEQGILNLNDIDEKLQEKDEEPLEELEFEMKDESVVEPHHELINYANLLQNKSKSALLAAKYERLKMLAQRPVKRIVGTQNLGEPEQRFRDSYEIHNLEKQICQISDAFRCNSLPIVAESFLGGVDADRCALKGLIPPSEALQRTLTPEEQSKVFTIDNFDCLSLPARYLVLKEYLNKIEQLIETSSEEELGEQDENGRSIHDYRDIFRRLIGVLEQKIGGMAEFKVRVNMGVREGPCEFVSYKYTPREDF